MALDLLYLYFKKSSSTFPKKINFDFQLCKANYSGGLHQEQGSRAAEVGVLSAFSKFHVF